MNKLTPIMLCMFLGIGVAGESLENSIFTDSERRHAEKALAALGMTRDDVNFEKDHGEPEWSLSWITNTLNEPYLLPETANYILEEIQKEDAESLWALASEVMETGEARERNRFEIETAVSYPDGFSKAMAETLDLFIPGMLNDAFQQSMALNALDYTNAMYLTASVFCSLLTTDLRPENRELLFRDASVPRNVQERVEQEADLLDGTQVALDWLALVNRIEPADIAAVGRRHVARARALHEELRKFTLWPDAPVHIETRSGAIIIGSQGDDIHSGSALLIIDPGGDDIYRNGAGVANGMQAQNFSTIIDLKGDDRYLSDGLLAPGSALFGFAVLIDGEGDDLYEGDYVGTAAAVYGAAWVEDHEGDDIYRAHALCQGAGIVGFGTLVDHEGNDHYQAGFYGQGFAGVKGWGLLLDRAGNDTYFAGNVRKDSDRNEDRYLSLSQGFSIGARPHAGGGVAALVDLDGNDTYIADVFGQGASYYYSAGFLIDQSGNDRYSLYQYGQGCGVHFSHGLLADSAGNDMYSGFILAQGAAHDYSVGMLFDQGGNDTYTADHHAQGRALNNAFAMLVDRDGDDGYFGRQRDGAQGIGNEGGFRDYGSLALLLDLAGRDIYSGGFSNGITTLRPLYGAVYDFDNDEVSEDE